MLFKRREPASFFERTRAWVWPKRGWLRSLEYYWLRLKRMRSTPHQIALGCAVGVFASITPLLGVQMLLAVLLAFLIRANIPAALIGTFFGNPLSWPIIWGATYFLGCYVLDIENGLTLYGLEYYLRGLGNAIASWSPDIIERAVSLVWPILKPMLAGSMVIGIATGAAVYYVVRPLVAAYQREHPSDYLSPEATI